MSKKRVLICSELHTLNTGYSNYSKELLHGLASMGKYEVAEYATYLSADEKRPMNVPWKIYPSAPAKNSPERQQFEADPSNVFGKYWFEKICLDFKAQYVIDFRDFWMLDYEGYSPFRPYYNLLWMPACDAEPQNEQWLYSYSQADRVFSYSDWGADLLRKSSNSKINVLGSASPCSPKEYVPLDIIKCKQHMKISPDSYILGTVMRNQRRKLYPELFESFRTFLDESGRSDIFLYCHTSYPDYGWDFPYLLKYHNITNRVLFTYKCKNKECGHFGANHFSDAATICPKCRQLTYCLPNVKDGLNHAEMAVVYNSMDLYVQYANCMPAGQKVLLKSGWTNIENVKTGDIAYTHTGKWQKVKQTFKKQNNNDVHEISVNGDSEKIRLTAEHPVFAITAKNSNYNRKHTSFRERLGELLRKGKKIPEPQFVDSKDLLPGDMIAYPINKNVVDINEIDLTEYCSNGYVITENEYRHKCSKASNPRKINVDLEFCKWLGLFVADGSWTLNKTGNSIRITSHIDEIKNHNLCVNTMTKFGNISVRKYKKRKALSHEIYNKVMTIWISKNCLKHEFKKLPDWVMDLPLDKQMAVLHGLFMGDGHYMEERFASVYNTISKVLAFQIKEILRRIGIVYNMNLVIKKGKRKPQYRFEIPGNAKTGNFSTKRNNTASINNGEYYLFKIKSNKIIDEEIDYVYNFEVDNDNSYCSLLGSVHNCEGFGMPCVEAAACGVPLTVVNYSAMCDFVNKLNAMPIEPLALYTELETGCKRAIPDNKQLVDNLKKFFTLPKAMQMIKRQSVRDAYLRNYNYEWTVKKWADAIDSIDNALPWNSPSRFKHPNTNVPPNLNNLDFVKWIIVNVLGDPSKIGTYFEARLCRDLTFSYVVGGQPGTYFNEDSEKFSRTPFAPFNRETAVNYLLNMRGKINHFEGLRCQNA